MARKEITHARALELIDERIGETVYVGFLFAEADDPEELAPVQHVVGTLGNPLKPRSPRLDPEVGFYEVGSNSFGLSPMAGFVYLRDNGIDFQVAERAMIRISWRGSSEIGDWRPTREALTKLNDVGIKLPEHEKPGVVLPGDADR